MERDPSKKRAKNLGISPRASSWQKRRKIVMPAREKLPEGDPNPALSAILKHDEAAS
jgi:hypothetical protein